MIGEIEKICMTVAERKYEAEATLIPNNYAEALL